MLGQNRWKKLAKFELRQRALFLKHLSLKQSLGIYSHLYALAYKLGAKRYVAELNSEKISSLARMHRIFRKVGL